MATLPRARLGVFSFWKTMTVALSAFIVFAFAQFALRGFVDYRAAPPIMHLHGMIMVAWLGLLVTQAMLAGNAGRTGRSTLAIHRRLGWASVVMVPLMVGSMSALCLTALRLHIQPPFFTPGYFLATVHVGGLLFAFMVALAVSYRRRSDWHRRLILGSTILLTDPALGRVLPMPLIVPWGEWVSLAIQLGFVALILRRDRRTLGRAHPATVAVAMAVLLSHVLTELLAITPWWIDLARRIASA
jgi:hypothetical protein